MYTAIDLFSGAGGLTEGLKQAGFRVVAAVEIDIAAQAVYRLNHPDTEHVWDDIVALRPGDLMRELSLEPGELDLLAGCPPCQGFSNIRTRNRGVANNDARNELIFQFLDFVQALRPKAIMVENVPRLATDVRMTHVLKALKHLGYYAGPDAIRVLDASDFEVPQRRKRMLFMTSIYGQVPFADPSTKSVTVRDAIGHLPIPERSRDQLHSLSVKMGVRVQEIVKSIPKDGGSRRSLPSALQLKCHRHFVGFGDVYGRMSWDEPAPTITAGCYHPSKGRFLHPVQDRPITLREAALLQGFRSSYQFPAEIGRTKIASMIGNALPPAFVAAHATRIRHILRDADRLERPDDRAADEDSFPSTGSKNGH